MRFGIISTAEIASNAVIPAIKESPHEVTAIASRDGERARAAATDLGIPNAYGSYETMFAEAPIDAVYNPLPNGLHAEWTERAADAGLDVLCEKPIAADAAEARAMFEYCDQRDVTLMEAFMYRFHPRTERAAEVVQEELGELRSGSATFAFRLDDPEDIRLDPDLAGGSLMDLGCYAVSAMRLFFGEPERVYARSGDPRDTGVDTQLTGVLEFESDATARIHSSFDTPLVESYRVDSEDGWLRAPDAFTPDGSNTLEYAIDGRRVTEEFDPVDPYRLEVEHFADAVATGKRPQIDATESLRNMAVIDALSESADSATGVNVSE